MTDLASSAYCLSRVRLLTALMVSLTFQSRRPRPGRLGKLPEVSQLVSGGAGPGARTPDLCPLSPSVKGCGELVDRTARASPDPQQRPRQGLEILTPVPGLRGHPRPHPTFHISLIWLASSSPLRPAGGRAHCPRCYPWLSGPAGAWLLWEASLALQPTSLL